MELITIPSSSADSQSPSCTLTPASETSTAYDEAVDDFYQEHYKDALPLFQKAQELYPDHPYVDTYINDTNAGIANGDDKSPAKESSSDSGGGLPGWLIPVAGGVAGLLVVLLLLLVVLRKRGSAIFTPMRAK